jgi:cation diffusion facilitator CzcD-associated flavoprotein CzcO
MEHQSRAEDEILDAIIVGGGLGGVFMLAEAVRQQYTRILLLERDESLGGLWTRVPAWQTVQNHPLDFCLQGFTTRKNVWQASDVLHYVTEYARVQNLQPFIRCSHDVVSCAWSDGEGCWVLQVHSGVGTHEELRCRKLVLCTGRHARPIVPSIDTDGSVPMVHSSQIQPMGGDQRTEGGRRWWWSLGPGPLRERPSVAGKR